MNRSPLNSATLGSGSRLPWITAAATQALRIVGTMNVSLRKYGAATQRMALGGHLKVIRYVTDSFTSTLRLVGSLPARVRVRVYGSAATFVSLVSSAKAYIKASAKASETLALSHAALAKVHRAIHGSAVGVLRVVGFGKGVDIYTGPAPSERIAPLIDVKPKTTTNISVGG